MILKTTRFQRPDRIRSLCTRAYLRSINRMFTAVFWAWGGKCGPALPKTAWPTVIGLLRSICQTRFPPPKDANLHELNAWLRRHRSIGRGDWDSILPGILEQSDPEPDPAPLRLLQPEPVEAAP